MLISALFATLLAVSGPNLDQISENDWELHPSLGVVVHVERRWIAYPIRMYTRVPKCTFLVDKDEYLLTYRICSGTIIMTLAEPTMWHNGDYKWQSMDNY